MSCVPRSDAPRSGEASATTTVADPAAASALTEIGAALRSRIGFEPSTVGPEWLRWTVERRMTVTGARSWREYAALARSDSTEFDQLVDLVCVPETWFFRDRSSYAFLSRLLEERWPPSRPSRPIRLLSLACSSGEEPYSMAITLLEAGVPADRFRIDALDLRRSALDRGRAGVYPRSAFRDRGPEPGRFWTEGTTGLKLDPIVRERVRFFLGNALEPTILEDRGPYDIVFCRNLLIYLDPPSRERLRRSVLRLMAVDGYLFAGPAEALSTWGRQFRAASADHAFVYGCADESADVEDREARASDLLPEIPTPRPEPVPEVEQAGGDLDEARRLADAGQLEAADALCELVLEREGPNADAYALQATVASARGSEDRVEGLLNRSLYLAPLHAGALELLAVERERRGDLRGAEIVRQRLRRAAAGEESP